jgi:hypothetical protein
MARRSDTGRHGRDPNGVPEGHFLAVYKDLEGKPTGVEGFAGRIEAEGVIERARDRAGIIQATRPEPHARP